MPRPDKVASLDEGIRLSEQRTIRSTCYRRKRDGISEFSRRRLALMESMLFSERRQICDCGPTDLMYPEAQFRCSEGYLCYHFSQASRKFVLTHFELVEGGGGARRPLQPLAGGHARFWPDQAVECPIAARLARFFVETFAAPQWPPYAGAPMCGRGLLSPMASIQALFGSLPTREVLCDIINVHWVLASTALDAPITLPEWSLLYRQVKIREQLENPFARAIFAGEALCRLGSAIVGSSDEGEGGDRLLGSPRIVGSVFDRSWLEESEAIIGVIGGNEGALDIPDLVKPLISFTCVGRDAVYDGRMRALLSSGLTLRLARAVAAQADAAFSFEANVPEEVRSAQVRVMMRKYSLLSEFAHRSASSFPVPVGLRGSDGIKELLGRSEPSGDTFRILSNFGNSSWLIVERFSVRRDSEGSPEPIEFGLERLRSLAREILGEEVGYER